MNWLVIGFFALIAEGAVLSAEVLLLLAIQRGKLSWILQWIHQAITVGKSSSDMNMSTEVLRIAFHHIKTSAGGGKMSDDLSSIFETSKICLKKAAKLLLSEVVIQSGGSNNSSQSTTGSTMHQGSIKSDAFLWGSNSSHQLAEGSQEKILLPKKTAAFQDVHKMEAGQYCTFVIQDVGHVSAVGKGSYGRLGLGDSTNQSIPRRLAISTPVKAVSSSKGSDGHTLALTEDGHVFSWYVIIMSVLPYYFNIYIHFSEPRVDFLNVMCPIDL